jgi:cbb3-type cytochrome oxidase cytochrome c subunit
MSCLRYVFYLSVAVVSFSIFHWWLIGERSASSAEEDPVAFGREVYISEGCIHCHSQYVRPVGQDMELWGARTTVEQALGQEPVLIGNRRQGPDLANVSERRNIGWNRLHLIEPGAVVPDSRMPSYRHLFERDAARGESLLIYLDSLRPSLLITDKLTLNAQHGER